MAGRFAHVVFEYRSQRVSLLVTAAERGLELRIPGEALEPLYRGLAGA